MNSKLESGARHPVTFSGEQQEGTQSFISRWLKSVGDTVTANDPLVEISTDKVTLEIAAPVHGILVEILCVDNQEIRPGDLLGTIAELEVKPIAESERSERDSYYLTTACSSSSDSSAGVEARLSPAVRKLLAENGISASNIKGSGRDGRITSHDVESFLKNREAGSTMQHGEGTPTPSLPSKRVLHTPMRQTIAKHMVHSLLHTAPHVTTVFDCDLENVLAHRTALRPAFERKGIALTLTAYFVQAAARALQAVPEINSRFHPDCVEVFEVRNIGVATALGNSGLVVPVIHNADQLSLEAIASRLKEITDRARAGKLSTSDMQGATFSITNHGVSGSLFATPIIPQPQSAILGIGKMERRAIVVIRDGKEVVEPRSRLYVTLTIDHRAIDGFVANSFLTAFVNALDNPTE